ncbi:hypothetical protein ACLOJK_020416 [Asimina triloba]
MATIATLQSSMTALSLTSSSFLGLRLPPLYSAPLPFPSRCMGALCECCVQMEIVTATALLNPEISHVISLPVLHKMHVKVGDTVKIISGREKGKIGEINQVIKHKSMVIIKDMNLKTKHVKSKEEGEPGQIIKSYQALQGLGRGIHVCSLTLLGYKEVEAPIHSSNVMLYSKEKEVASRVGHKFLEDGTRVRYLIKTGEIIDSKENWEKRKALEVVKETESVTA